MSIKYAILGFLSWTPQTGYDLKKLFEESATFHWSGNNNQIYKALVELHNEGLVTLQVQQQVDRPPRKIYSISEQGLSALREWVLSEPELPQVKHSFLVRLAWADQLTPTELDKLIEQYGQEVEVQLLMFREHKQRNQHAPQRTPREIYLWEMILQRWISLYENELEWIQALRDGLSKMPKGET
jgi:PadR family transcriptional regulator AphA